MTAGKMRCRAAVSLMVGLVASAPAAAADLSGDSPGCCAGLEDRIAELESLAARKGQRKVSLEISGHVNQAIMFWDDGFEENAYVVTNDQSATRVRMKGSAKFASGWTAGYTIEVGYRSANSKRFTQDDPTATSGSDVDLRHNYWYLESSALGRLTVGLTSGASDKVTEVNLAQTRYGAKYSDVEDTGLGLAMRLSNGLYSNGTTSAAGAFTWRRLIRDYGTQPGEGGRSNIVKYDTPEWRGLTATVNWGEDDFWEAGIRFEGEMSGLKLAAALAYGENTEFKTGSGNVGFECLGQLPAGTPPGSGNNAKCREWGGSVSFMHVESGLYANFAAGAAEDDTLRSAGPAFAGADRTSVFWAAEAGLERKWISIGKTTLFAQYYDLDGGASTRRTFGADAILATGLTSFSGGIVQAIERADMQLYVFARHYDGSVTTSAGHPDLEELDVITAGAIIKF